MKDVHHLALEIVGRDRKSTEELLIVLRRIEKDRSYLEQNVDSLHAYCTKFLKYSEGAATRRVNASRIFADTPATVEKFRRGSLNLSHLSFAQSFIQSEEKHTGMKMSVEAKMDVLSKIEGKTQDESRRILQSEFPDAPFGRESTRIVDDDVEIRFLADPDFMAKLEEVRAKHAHSPEFASIAGTFKALLEKDLTRSHNAGVVSAAKTREVFRRAGHRCQHERDGKRCTRRYHLQVDHIIPRARGGTGDLDNLQALCRAHNLRKG